MESYSHIHLYMNRSLDMNSCAEAAIGIANAQNAAISGCAEALASGNSDGPTCRPGMRQYGFPIEQFDEPTEMAVSARGLEDELLILGLSATKIPRSDEEVDRCEYIALHSRCPVLFVPASWRNKSIGKSILIGWNGSPSADRSIVRALPFLRRAQKIQVAAVSGGLISSEELDASGSALTFDCKRLGLSLEHIPCSPQANPGAVLLTIADHEKSDLLVMGCVAHPHWRNVLLGGASRVVLQNALAPVLMFH